MTPEPAWALDTETRLITDQEPFPRIVCVALVHRSGERFLVEPSEALFRGCLAEGLAGHNVAYDLGCAVTRWPDLMSSIFAAYEDGRVRDTMIRERLLDVALGRLKGRRHSLDTCLERRGIHMAKDVWRLSYGSLEGRPIESWPYQARLYPLEDSEGVWTLLRDQDREAPDGTWDDEARQTAAAWWLALMSAEGLRTDPARVRALEAMTQDRVSEILPTLRVKGWIRPDGSRNMKAIRAAILEAYPAAPRTPTGLPKTDEDTCLESKDPDLALLGEYQGLGSILSSDLEFLRRPVVRTRYQSLVETGRTSSSGPNIQNLKTSGGIRECFTPRPGSLYVGADYSGLELCSFAQVCLANLGHSRLAELLNQGLDPHLDVAARILGIPYEEAKTRGTKDPEIYLARQTGKVANFGFPGGLGFKSLVEYARALYRVSLTPEDARRLKGIWQETLPETRDYFPWIESWFQGGERTTIRHTYSGRLRGGVYYTQACNSFFQGLGSDIAKAGGWALARECYLPKGRLAGVRPVLFVHDEFMAEAPEGSAPEAAEILAECMIQGGSVFTPGVRLKAEPYVSRIWSKKAEGLRDPSGRLMVWGP